MTGGFALDIPERRDSSFAVYVDGEPDQVNLVVGHLRRQLARDGRPSAQAAAEWFAGSAYDLRVVPRAEAPALPPRELLASLGQGQASAAVVDHATHVATVTFELEPRVPRMALWGSFALACALARAYEGELFDPEAMRFVPDARARDALAGAEDDSVAPVVALLHSAAGDGSGSLTTLGLRRFGLPDLAWEDVPGDPRALVALQPAILGVAQWLVDEVAQTGGRRWVPGAATIDAARLARANMRPELARTRALLEFTLSPPDGYHAGVLMLRPDTGGVDVRSWLAANIGDGTVTPSGDGEMDEAMARARESIERAKSAFLERNELTYVKRRFEARAGRPEYIWIAVDKWQRGTIAGRLANAPIGDVGYSLDRRIEFDENEAVDWIVSARDGTRSGNYTGEVLAAREGSTPPGA